MDIKTNKSAIDLMADYVFLSKYSQMKEDGTLETWEETIDRIYSMHETKLRDLKLMDPLIKEWIERAKKFEKEKKILSSQRGRQFASPKHTSGILKHEAKLYNCCSTFIDRTEVFGEIMYLLLCGCGVGYSLHKEYVNKLPEVQEKTGEKFKHVISDDIEGWGNSIHILIENLYKGIDVAFIYDLIRPEGALIDGKFLAPGHEKLEKAHNRIRDIFSLAKGRKLTTLELHDVICYIAESVVSGGVRRSAMIALFDKDDTLMLTAKTGNWYDINPQRAMANNSILTSFEDTMSHSELRDKIQIVRQFGEPGSVNLPSYRYTVNPCGEIVMEPQIDGRTGFAFCNLVEINAERINTFEEFIEACEISSFVATVQSLYTDFKFLSPASRDIADRDRAIGVSITGLYANPLLRGEVLSKGADKVAVTNHIFSGIFGIAKSRTCTTVKPSGNASAILGLHCSGIHAAHDRKYLRRVRIKTNSPEYEALKDTPLVKILRKDDALITFAVEVENPNTVYKDDISAAEHMKFISEVKHFWVNKGGIDKKAIPNNVSATVEVKDDEWNEATAILYVNNHLYTGVSFIGKSGDQIYEQAPFQRLSNAELVREWERINDFYKYNPIDFNSIMSKRANIESGEMVAVGCSGGACELK